jgi:hypothetical protein
MRPTSILFCALIAAVPTLPAGAAQPSPESAAFSAEKLFFAAPALPRFQKTPALETILQDPAATLLAPARIAGGVVASVRLAGQLDRHRDLLTRQLGPTTWNISVAGDPAFKTWFLTFSNGSRLVIAPLGDLNRLRGDGIDVTVEPGVVYNFHVSINIFNPVRGSTLEIHAANGTSGPDHDINTGDLLDAIKAKSFVFNADGNEYWMLYGTDVDPATNTLGKTRSFAFIHEAGMSTKAWPMAESSLPEASPVGVTFGDKRLVLLRTADGALQIQRP